MNTHSVRDRIVLGTSRFNLIALAIVATLAFAPAAYALQTETAGNMQDFETTLSPWVPAGDHQLTDAWSIDRPSGDSVTCDPVGRNGKRYATLTGQTVPAAGQAYWLVSGVPAYGPVEVKVSFFARSTRNCMSNCEVVAAVAARPPYDGAQFSRLGAVTKSWQYYEYRKTLVTAGTAYVAFGWGSRLGPMPADESQQVGYDCVNVTVTSITDSAQ